MKPTYHIVSHSHWDREWYFPFDRFRAMLVDMIEDLIELFDRDPEFKSYTLDGQLAAVMDYLETRPDRAETIRDLVSRGKLFIGPWYILNDEFLSSGESHLRNLSLGFRMGAELGGVMRVGYIPDQFGHIAQMPQILQGFGIDTALIYRGFGGEAGQERSEYWWISPDGSKVLMHHLPKDGYSAGYFGTQDSDTIVQKFDRLRSELDARATTSQRLFFNGGDHHWPDVDVTAAIRVLRRAYDAEFHHSNFPDFLTAVKKEIGSGESLPRLEGETRFGYRHAFAVLGGVFSSRMYLKQLNAECEVLLERYLEPVNVIASTSGLRSKAPQIEQAWKYVLQNQDHDAICGTSIDDVHREMMIRYAKAKHIADHVMAECFGHLLPYDERAYKDDCAVFAYNPSPWSRSDVVETEVEFYLQDVVVGLNPEVKVDPKLPGPQGFKLIDSGGIEVPYQIVRRGETFGVTYSKRDYPHQTLVDRFSILVSADQMPPLGWKGFSIVRSETTPQYPSSVTSGRYFIENQFLRIEADDRGTTLTNRSTGVTYQGLNVFEDSADVGDEYNYSYPPHDTQYTSEQFVPRISLEEAGPLRATLKIEHQMAIPREALNDGNARSPEMATLSIVTRYSLTGSSRRVDVTTTVHNTCNDHRLRALFRTGIETNESFAETPFAVTKREHRSYDPSLFTFEHPAMVAPMQRFVTIGDTAKGFTLIVKGLPEYELKINSHGDLALTLLRCVGKLSGRDLITRPGGAAGWWNETPEAQCHGTHTFEYSLFPHGPIAANVWTDILEQAEAFTTPAITIRRKNKQSVLESSFLSVSSPALVLTAVKCSDDNQRIVVRLNNPVDAPVSGSVHFNLPVKRAQRANMREEAIGVLTVAGGHDLEVSLKPFEVYTILVTF